MAKQRAHAPMEKLLESAFLMRALPIVSSCKNEGIVRTGVFYAVRDEAV
jgi:hypothetical protein